MNAKLKLAVVSVSQEESSTVSAIVNRLAGLEYNHATFGDVCAKVRILEIAWNNNSDIELWEVKDHGYALPNVCAYDLNGVVLVSSEVPKTFIEKNGLLFPNRNFPLLWLVPERNYRYSPLESGLTSYNIYKTQFEATSDDVIYSEFNGWLAKVHGSTGRK